MRTKRKLVAAVMVTGILLISGVADAATKNNDGNI